MYLFLDCEKLFSNTKVKAILSFIRRGLKTWGNLFNWGWKSIPTDIFLGLKKGVIPNAICTYLHIGTNPSTLIPPPTSIRDLTPRWYQRKYFSIADFCNYTPT